MNHAFIYEEKGVLVVQKRYSKWWIQVKSSNSLFLSCSCSSPLVFLDPLFLLLSSSFYSHITSSFSCPTLNSIWGDTCPISLLPYQFLITKKDFCISTVHATHSVLNVADIRWEEFINVEVTVTLDSAFFSTCSSREEWVMGYLRLGGRLFLGQSLGPRESRVFEITLVMSPDGPWEEQVPWFT